MAVVIFHYFWDGDRTFVWAQDGLKQHYRALSYYSKWLRELIFRFFGLRGGLPLYSFSIGYGSDILTTLHYYAIGDPLNLLCIFVPEKSMLYLYEFLILLRFYLAGIAFSYYCFYRGKRGRILLPRGTYRCVPLYFLRVCAVCRGAAPVFPQPDDLSAAFAYRGGEDLAKEETGAVYRQRISGFHKQFLFLLYAGDNGGTLCCNPPVCIPQGSGL